MVEFDDYVAAVGRQRRLIAIVVGSAIALAMVATVIMPRIYTAEARVLVRPTVSPGDTSTEEVNIDTERGVGQSLAVAAIAAETLTAAESPSALLSGLSVEPVPDSQILVFSYSDDTPRSAFRAADAFANAYLQFRRQEADAVTQAGRQVLEASREEANAQRAQINEELSGLGNGPRRSELESDRQVVQNTLTQINTDLEALKSRSVDPGTVIDGAEVPSSPSSPSFVLNLVGATLVGLIAALCLAFIRERHNLGRPPAAEEVDAPSIAPPAPAAVDAPLPVDHRAPVPQPATVTGPPERRNQIDVEATLTQAGVPVLGTVPRLTNDASAPPFDSVTMLTGPVGDQMRVVRDAVRQAMAARDIKSLLVTTPEQRGIVVGIAGSLAVTLAQDEQDVLLLAGDLEQPTLHRRFQLNNDQGLVEALRGHRPLAQVMQGWGGYETLVVVTAGQVADASPQLLSAQNVRGHLDRIRGDFDAILLEAAPVLSSAHTAALATACDGALLAVDPRGSHPERIVAAATELNRRTVLLGGVVIEARRRSERAAPAPLGLPSVTSS